MAQRPRPDYGFDAPAVPAMLGVVALLFILATIETGRRFGDWWWLIPLAYAIFFLASCGSFVYTTRRGKFAVWRELLSGHATGGLVVDLGCGRGAVLNLAASGRRAVGVDLWRSVDQSGNDPTATLRNAAAEGVQVHLLTADMRALPLADGTADLVVSSLAMHNIPESAGRLKAVTEAARVLRPGGRLTIVDFRHSALYADELRRLGLSEVATRRLGWRFWYGGPWGGAVAVTARK